AEYRLGNYAKAIEDYLAALRHAEENGIRGMEMSAYNNLANVYIDQKNFEEALRCFGEGSKIAAETGNVKGKATAYGGKGLVFHSRGQYDSALFYFSKAKEDFEMAGDLNGALSAWVNIATIYYAQGDSVVKHSKSHVLNSRYELALRNYDEALKIAEKINDQVNITSIKINKGGIYASLQKYGECELLYREALKISESI